MKPFGFTATLLFLYLIISQANVYAQSASLMGKVTDAKTGEILPGANIKLGSGHESIGTAANTSGEFRIKNLYPGTYVVEVSFIGYEKETRTVVVFSGEIESLQFTLRPTQIKFNPLVITASRRPEKALDAPAAVTIVDGPEIASRPVLNTVEHIKGLPGVDVATTGINSNRVVVRGFNGSFSGRLLSLTDYRIANVPSLRVNVSQLIPTTNEDIERIEIVAGPGSALYGPNAAGGVMHIITKSPFDSKGTQVSLGIGERNIVINSFRHAGAFNHRVGYKVAGQYYRGDEWKFFDATEPDSITKGIQTSNGRIDKGTKILNKRNFDVEKFSGDARLDFRLHDDFTAVLSGGFSRISNIEITGGTAGTFQVDDWTTSYLQGRFTYKNLFMQTFYNWNDSGDTYSLRNGDLIIDRSSLLVAQAQHAIVLMNGRQNLTYGADILLTRPDSDNTIYGRNENDDDINEIGLYLQSEMLFPPKVKILTAVRFDDQNHLPEPVFSPRTALVYKHHTNHHFRLTFNQAYESPATQDLFIDINSGQIGPYAFRFRGVPPKTGYHFRRDENGGIDNLYMQSPFTPESGGGREAFVPADATLTWDAIVAILQEQGIDLSAIPAPTSEQVQTLLRRLNTTTANFDPANPKNVLDIPPLEPRKTTTLEFGYRGVFFEELLFVTNIYHENNKNFFRGFRTPNVFFDPASLADYLGNFLPVDDATSLAEEIAELPVGTVTPEEGDSADLISTTRNFGDVSHFGTEFGLTYFATPNWTISGNYNYLSKNLFKAKEDQPSDIPMGAPKHKLGVSVSYQNPRRRLSSQVRLRYVDGFPVTVGEDPQVVKPYAIVDLNGGYTLPFHQDLALALSIQNLFNNKHREYISVPEIGRLTIVHVTYTF